MKTTVAMIAMVPRGYLVTEDALRQLHTEPSLLPELLAVERHCDFPSEAFGPVPYSPSVPIFPFTIST